MQTRTWPYGTEKSVVVEQIFRVGNPTAVIAVDDHREGYAMLGSDHDVEPIKGGRFVIRFVAGGPNGGYWKIVREVSA